MCSHRNRIENSQILGRVIKKKFRCCAHKLTISSFKNHFKFPLHYQYLSRVYCILDIESTGGSFGKEAIIEIALFRYDGDEVVDQLISLVHPHRDIQKFVSKITGITPKMLIRAPRFHEIAKRIIELTEGAILVGHNVEFDYRMLRQEFDRLGYTYERKTLDTIQLAENLIPGLASYGLDRICEELGIDRINKHRAESDALATLDLFKILQEKDRKKDIGVLGQSIVPPDYLKDKLSDLSRSLKITRGIYYLHDREGKLLFLGSSNNIKKSLNQLFVNSDENKDLLEAVNSIRAEESGNWLIARSKKHSELKKVKPPFNEEIVLDLPLGVFLGNDSALTVKPLGEMKGKTSLLKTESHKAGFRAIRMFKRMRNQERKDGILELLNDFPAKGVFTGKGRSKGERSAFWVEDHLLQGYFYFNLNEQLVVEDRLKKNLSVIDQDREIFTELLKLGLLSGEYYYYSHNLANSSNP